MYTRNRYNEAMIKSFADKETEKVYHQTFSRKLPENIQRVALRKLIMIDNAERLEGTISTTLESSITIRQEGGNHGRLYPNPKDE